jgi:uncharacterized membrane protein
MKTDKKRYLVLTIGAAIGLVAAFLQTIEKLVLIENKNASLPCNISDIFSCSTVLNAPQSSLFGFPNSLICMIVFTIFLTIGIAGLLGSRLTIRTLYGVQALALFMLAFAIWFLFTSTFVIAAICIFCLFCFAGLLMLNGALWRLNSSFVTDGWWSNVLNKLSNKNFDILLWLVLVVVLAAAIIIKFYIP